MKKIIGISIMLMMLISISSLAIADEEQDHDDETQEQKDIDVDSETEKEIFVMNNSLGAEIRLLQLQKALLKNIFKGNMTIEVLKVLGFNTTALEDILDQMKEVLEEVKAANTSSNESVQIFVDLKNQSKNFTTQFRETIRELLDNVTLQELKEMIKENFSEQLQDLDKNIRNKIRHFNRNQLYRLYGLIGKVNDSFIEDYLNGNVSLNLTKIQLCKIINQLTKEKRYLIFSEIKEDNIKGKIHAKTIIDEMKNKGKGKGHGNND